MKTIILWSFVSIIFLTACDEPQDVGIRSSAFQQTDRNESLFSIELDTKGFSESNPPLAKMEVSMMEDEKQFYHSISKTQNILKNSVFLFAGIREACPKATCSLLITVLPMIDIQEKDVYNNIKIISISGKSSAPPVQPQRKLTTSLPVSMKTVSPGQAAEISIAGENGVSATLKVPAGAVTKQESIILNWLSPPPDLELKGDFPPFMTVDMAPAGLKFNIPARMVIHLNNSLQYKLTSLNLKPDDLQFYLESADGSIERLKPIVHGNSIELDIKHFSIVYAFFPVWKWITQKTESAYENANQGRLPSTNLEKANALIDYIGKSADNYYLEANCNLGHRGLRNIFSMGMFKIMNCGFWRNGLNQALQTMGIPKKEIFSINVYKIGKPKWYDVNFGHTSIGFIENKKLYMVDVWNNVCREASLWKPRSAKGISSGNVVIPLSVWLQDMRKQYRPSEINEESKGYGFAVPFIKQHVEEVLNRFPQHVYLIDGKEYTRIQKVKRKWIKGPMNLANYVFDYVLEKGILPEHDLMLRWLLQNDYMVKKFPTIQGVNSDKSDNPNKKKKPSCLQDPEVIEAFLKFKKSKTVLERFIGTPEEEKAKNLMTVNYRIYINALKKKCEAK